jgi:hypothetical protein
LTGYFADRTAPTLNTISTTGNSFTPGQMMWMNDTLDEFVDGRIAHIRVWDAVLSQKEIERERWSYVPVRRANLHLWNPCTTLGHAQYDFSGNNRPLTTAGATTEPDPLIAWQQTALKFNPKWSSVTGATLPSIGAQTSYTNFPKNKLSQPIRGGRAI